MRWESPWAFLLLVPLGALLWWRQRRMGKGAAIRFSWTGAMAGVGEPVRQRVARLWPWLRLPALVLLVLALARPQRGMEMVREVNEGIAIAMLVDRSSSMGAEMVYQGQRMNRLEVVKRVFEAFVLGDGGALAGRGNDLIGLITFARYAETVCPLTLTHGALPQFLQTVRLAQPRTEEDGTAIGDAVALGAARLYTAEEMLAKQALERTDRYVIQSKVIILLTDGAQTAGKREPKEAARLAQEWGIKIYAIAVTGEDVPRGGDSLLGRLLRGAGRQDFDTETLKAMAEITGGRFFEAKDAGALAGVYEEIDRLERSRIEAVRYMDYKELFGPFALGGLLLLTLEVVLGCTWLRRIP